MAQTDLSTLRNRVLDIVRRSPIAPSLKEVSVTADSYDDTSGFLDIAVELKSLDRISDDTLLRVISAIEDGLIPIDERFPSVRFPADASI